MCVFVWYGRRVVVGGVCDVVCVCSFVCFSCCFFLEFCGGEDFGRDRVYVDITVD